MRLLFNGFRHGHIRALYKRALADPEVEIVGCIEEDDAARTAAAEALGVSFSDRSFASWLADPALDAVAIGGAYGMRGEAVIRALAAGKHVIADKPICTDLAQLAEIARLAREKGLCVGCMLDLRDLPQVAAAKAVLQSGTLGTVRSVSFNGQHCIDYAHRPTWYFEQGMHGGTINDLAIHGVDLVRMLTGEELTQVDAARSWNAYATQHPHFRDAAHFMARFGEVAVLADVSYSAPSQVFSMPTYWEFRIWCERGMLSFCYRDADVTVYEEGRREPTICHGLPVEGDYLAAFLRAVEMGDAALTEGVLRSTEAALRIQAAADAEVKL